MKNISVWIEENEDINSYGEVNVEEWNKESFEKLKKESYGGVMDGVIFEGIMEYEERYEGWRVLCDDVGGKVMIMEVDEGYDRDKCMDVFVGILNGYREFMEKERERRGG